MNTKYYFSLTFKNNAATALTAPTLTGSFTTTAEVRPDWSAKKWALIGDSISDPKVEYNGTGVSPYYNFVARDTGIQVAYLSAIGSTGWGHDKDADPTGCPCFYKRLLSDKWRLPSDIDVVTIFGSNNDRHQFYNNIGNATDTFEDGKDTYCCYVNGTIELVRQQAPNAKIIIISGVYGHGTEQVKLDAVTAAVRAVAEHQNIPFYDWATEDPNNPYDLHRMSDFDKTTGPKEGDFAYKYIVDWGLWNINTGRFGHPNSLYHEEYYSPKFRQLITDAFASGPASAGETIRLDVPTARPSTDYNGSAVSVSFTGTLPEGSVATAKVTVGGVDYAGTISGGAAFFTVPADVATAGNTYTGTITVTVDGKDYSKAVTLSQGSIVAEVNASWIAESATALNTTGTWSGDKAVAANGRIAVSNAVFTAATPSPTKAVVTITSTLDFVGANEDPFPASAMAGVKVVKVAGANRYAFLTGNGVVTNLEATANVRSAVAVTTTIDLGTDEVSYTIAGTTFGPYSRVGSAARVSGVRFDGETSVDSVAGSHRFEGLDASLASVNGVKYATVDEAVAAAGGSTVNLLWDASWAPAKGGDYTLSKNGFNLAIGGELAYSVKDNGNGTVTVSVTGGAESDVPQATQITFVGNTIKVGVENAKAGLWYALEKTTDLTKPFAIDASTWTSGDDIIAGDKDLVVQLGGTDKQAFYRVVVSTTAP